MEQTLSEIWESSRSNQYSWILPSVLTIGSIWILILTNVRRVILRRILKVGSFFLLLYVAIWASSMQISEKWKIRHQWAGATKSTLTDQERQALTSDGANLVMGPVIYGGGGGFMAFGISLILSSAMTRKMPKESQQANAAGTT